MRIFGKLKGALVMTCLLGFAAAAWSGDAEKSIGSAQDEVGNEAVVSVIDNEKITLRSTTDQNRMCTIPLSNAGELLKVGDKVRVQGNIVKKIEAKIDSDIQAPSASGSQVGTP